MSNTWPTEKIGKLFSVQLGKMLDEKAKKGKLAPYLANFNVRWGSFDFSRLNTMAFSENERHKFSLSPGDLLMCEGGEIGRCAVWKENNREIYYQKALHRLRPINQGINTDFTYYYMQHIATKGELPKIVGETSIAHLTLEKLLRLKVPVPTILEQNTIVSLLSTWDLAIEKTERLTATKQQRLAVHRDRLSHKTPHSKRMKLHEVTHESTARNGVRLGRDSIMAVTKAVGMRPMKAETIAANIERYKVVRPKGFAYNPMRLNIGSIAMSPFDADILVSPDYVVFECDESKLLSGYLNHLRFSRHWTNYFENAGNGSVRIRIYYDDLAAFAFELPPVEEQLRIVEFLDAAQLEIDLLKKQADAYRRQKRGLMQKLLTGKWRVRLE